jgi:hypothetical protein
VVPAGDAVGACSLTRSTEGRQPVLKFQVGDQIRLTQAGFGRPSAAFLAEIERKLVQG